MTGEWVRTVRAASGERRSTYVAIQKLCIHVATVDGQIPLIALTPPSARTLTKHTAVPYQRTRLFLAPLVTYEVAVTSCTVLSAQGTGSMVRSVLHRI
jgi:hypothetical protein